MGSRMTLEKETFNTFHKVMILEVMLNTYHGARRHRQKKRPQPETSSHKNLKYDIARVILNHLTPNGHYMGRTAQLTSRCCIFYIYSTNILNMLHNLRFFFSSKCRLFHNATFFGSCIIHILNTECAKI